MTALTAAELNALAVRAQGGDTQAFADLWRHLNPQIVGYLRTRVPAAAAEDLAQETFLNAWRGRSTWRPAAGSVETWLYAIASNVAIDHLRYAGRRPVVYDDHVDAVDDTDVAEQVADNIDARTNATAARARVAAALATLPERQAQVVAARHLFGMSVAEVAIRLRIPHHPGTVKSVTHRGMAALRAALAALPDDLPEQVPPLPMLPPRPPDPARVALGELAAAAPAVPVPDSRSVPHAVLVTSTHRHRPGRSRPTGRRRIPGPVLAFQQTVSGPDRAGGDACGMARRRGGLAGVATRHRPGRTPVLRCEGVDTAAEARRHRLGITRRGDAAVPRPRYDRRQPQPSQQGGLIMTADLIAFAAFLIAVLVCGALLVRAVVRRGLPDRPRPDAPDVWTQLAQLRAVRLASPERALTALHSRARPTGRVPAQQVGLEADPTVPIRVGAANRKPGAHRVGQ